MIYFLMGYFLSMYNTKLLALKFVSVEMVVLAVGKVPEVRDAGVIIGGISSNLEGLFMLG